MSINITYTAQTLTPAYNPVEFYFSGNNNTKLGYRYIVDVYDTNNNRISRQKVVPQANGQGKIDISRILSNLVTVSFDPTTNLVTNATNSYLNYKLSIGEEYIPDAWVYTGITSYLYGSQLAAQLNGVSAHTFVTLDQIYVTNAQNLSIAGFRQVLSGSTTLGVVTNRGYFSGYNVPTSGTVQFASGKKLVTSGVNTSLSAMTVFNGIRSVADFITYSAATYTIDSASTTDRMLTNLPDNFYAAPTQDIKLNAYLSKVNTQTYAIRYIDNLGATNNVYPIAATATTKEVVQFNVGYNAMGLSNSANILWYDVWIVNTTGNIQLSKKYRIFIDKRCAINDYEIAFQDRMGSIASFNFQLRSKESGTIQRTQYKQQLATSYKTTDRGNTNIFIEFNKDYELNTNWITDEMSLYFEELLTSPYQWVKMGGVYYACTVTDVAFETERQKNKRLIKKTIKIRLANNDSVNI
jgi:hypothetical protein